MIFWPKFNIHRWERKYNTEVYNIISIFLVWAAPKLLPTNVVSVLVFWAALNSWNICSRLILFRVNCFTGNSSRNKKICSIKTTKKSSAEQKPQSKVISITRLQTNKLLVASQRVVSRESKSCKLRVYHIASQLIMSLSHFQLHANKPVSCKPVSLWVANHQVNNF